MAHLTADSIPITPSAQALPRPSAKPPGPTIRRHRRHRGGRCAAAGRLSRRPLTPHAHRAHRRGEPLVHEPDLQTPTGARIPVPLRCSSQRQHNERCPEGPATQPTLQVERYSPPLRRRHSRTDGPGIRRRRRLDIGSRWRQKARPVPLPTAAHRRRTPTTQPHLPRGTLRPTTAPVPQRANLPRNSEAPQARPRQVSGRRRPDPSSPCMRPARCVVVRRLTTRPRVSRGTLRPSTAPASHGADLAR